jgi:HK97 family phage major capsid protein
MSTLTQKIPFVDSTSHASSIFGGMVFYWTEESAAITATEAKFGRVELSAKKLTGGARVPNELWNDASALGSWLLQTVPAGLAYYEDDAFINGTGVGQPLGVFNSPAVVAASRQTASKIESVDIYAMYARMLPQSLNRAVWVANQETLPELLGMSHVISNVAGTENVGGSAAGIVQVGNISGAPSMSILGRPLIITEKAAALNTQGDISFIDFGHYLIGDRQAISIDSSEHSRFMNDETELRIIERVDGRPWVQSAVTPKNGTATLSPYVQLATA